MLTTSEFLASKYNNEKQLMALCVKWCNHNYPESRGMMLHVPNENSHKEPGIVSGVPDLLNWYPQFAIELKFEKGKVSDTQERIHKIWSNHAPVYVCRTPKEFYDVIVKHYGMPKQ